MRLIFLTSIVASVFLLSQFTTAQSAPSTQPSTAPTTAPATAPSTQPSAQNVWGSRELRIKLMGEWQSPCPVECFAYVPSQDVRAEVPRQFRNIHHLRYIRHTMT